MKAQKNPLPKLSSLIFWVLLIVILGWILVFSDYSFLNTWKLKRSVDELETAVTELQTNNDSLRAENERLKTSPEAAEKAAREKFGLTKPGEKVFRFVPPAESEE
ncbi:MAG: septum formation initiator family protein [Candidatus Cloacimonadota bacterium]